MKNFGDFWNHLVSSDLFQKNLIWHQGKGEFIEFNCTNEQETLWMRLRNKYNLESVANDAPPLLDPQIFWEIFCSQDSCQNQESK